MRIKDVKQQIEVNIDILYQAGYDLGWNSVIQEIQQEADREWNLGNETTSKVMQKLIERFSGEEFDDVA